MANSVPVGHYSQLGEQTIENMLIRSRKLSLQKESAAVFLVVTELQNMDTSLQIPCLSQISSLLALNQSRVSIRLYVKHLSMLSIRKTYSQ